MQSTVERSIIETGVVVVGASAAGLATAACLAKAGVDHVVLERSAAVAAPWRQHYDRLQLNSSRALSGLPHFPMPARLPRFPSRAQMVGYLEAYAAHLHIQPRFSQEVLRLERESRGECWRTVTARTLYRSRHVVVATGRLKEPHQPVWAGMSSFGGPIVHSAAYRNGAAHAGQRVLVIGFGNSGADIALDLCEHGARVSLAVRGAVNVVPRSFLGVPIDVWGLGLRLLPSWLGDRFGRAVTRLSFGSLARLGLRALPFGPVTGMRQHALVPTLDTGTMARIRRGDIQVLPGPTAFAPGAVHFSDGTARPFDAVVLATGHRPGLAALLGPGTEGALNQTGEPRASGCAVLPGLFFCGYRVTLTGMLRRIGQEARSIAASIAADPLAPPRLARPQGAATSDAGGETRSSDAGPPP